MKSGSLSNGIIAALIGWIILFIPFGLTADHLDSLERSLQDRPVDSAYIEAQMLVAREYHQRHQHGDRCMEVAREAVENAVNFGDIYLYAKALDNLGLLYRYHQYYAQAIPLHRRAFDLTEHLNVPPLSKMIFANNTGVAARHNGNYDISVLYYMKALAIAEWEQNVKNMEIANNGLGIALMNISGREEEALTHLKKALEIAKGSGNKLGQAMNYLSIGSYYDDIGNYTEARKYFRELYQLNEGMDDQRGIAITLEAFGNSFLRENTDLLTAQSYFERSQHLYDQLGDQVGRATVLASLGDLFLRRGQINRALESYFAAYEIASVLSNNTLVKSTAEAISQAYERRGDAGQALTYYRIAQQYKDSIALHEQEIAISAIKHQYDLESKQAQIELLTKDKALAEVQLQRRNLIIIVLVALFATVGIAAFFRARVKRIKQRSAELIKQQEDARMRALYERNLMEAEIIATRMQINPHFMFNCLGSIRFLVEKGENDKALRYLLNFSSFTRRVLEISNRPVHCVSEELKLLNAYLKLEKERFDGDFSYQILNRMEQWEERDVIPALLLQPFVENAICHGLASSHRPEKRLQIIATSGAAHIELTIEDNGVGLPTEQCGHRNGYQSMGHRITNKRIDLFNKSHPDHIQWQIENIVEPDGHIGGTRVRVAIFIVDKTEPGDEARITAIPKGLNLPNH